MNISTLVQLKYQKGSEISTVSIRSLSMISCALSAMITMTKKKSSLGLFLLESYNTEDPENLTDIDDWRLDIPPGIHQARNEMIRTAGDFLAKTLAHGNNICKMNVYGLAYHYKTGTARLLKLVIDFDKEEAKCYYSDDSLDNYNATLWLLNSITCN